jgi:PKD repeat protein
VKVPWTQPNRVPLAALSVSATNARTGVQLEADAASSSDPDGDALEFMFDWGDGVTSQWGPSPSTAHSYATAGNWTVTVSVRDPLGLVASATRAVEVTAPPPNAGPMAVLTISSRKIEAGRTLTVNGSGSHDPDAGDSIEARVDWGDGNVTAWAALAILSHAYASPGTYTVTLEVRDRLGLNASAQTAVTVVPVPFAKKKKDNGFIPGAGAAGALAAMALMGVVAVCERRRSLGPPLRRGRVK